MSHNATRLYEWVPVGDGARAMLPANPSTIRVMPGANDDDSAVTSGTPVADVITAIVGVVAAVALAWRFSSEPLIAIALAVTAVTSARLSQIDFREHRLPNQIVGPLALFAAVAVVLFGVVDNDIERSGSALLVAAIAFVILFVVGLANGIGMGDVKFSFPLVALLAWLGRDYLTLAALVMVLTAGLYTVVLMVSKRSLRFFVPFGPFMAAGLTVSALLLGPSV